MRVSTAMFQQASLDAILRQQVEMGKTQQQLATGKRILTPADDPIASATLVDINQSMALYEQFNRNADQAEMRLSQEESILKSVGGALQRARELAVQGNNDTYSAEQRKNIAAEVRQILDEALTLANSTDGNNNFLFAGTLSNTKPFDQNFPGEGEFSSFVYNGDQGQRRLQIGPQRTVADSDSGFEVFGKVRLEQIEIGPISQFNFESVLDDVDPSIVLENNNAGFNIDGIPVLLDANYANISELASAIQTQLNFPNDPAIQENRYEITTERGFLHIRNTAPGAGPVNVRFSTDPLDTELVDNASAAGFHQASSLATVFDAIDKLAVALESDTMSGGRIEELDAALGHIIQYQSTIGARMNSVDRQREVNSELVFRMTEIKSELEDLDYASTISNMNMQLVGMQAAQQTFTRVQNLSLFNYL
ncbi:MAG: flagellar hook-associated protein FlgL [Gammaproteobacteria bacterium]|nr:flagellar hook-associated protein FlgL [Gammaproteobacteria bacterium]